MKRWIFAALALAAGCRPAEYRPEPAPSASDARDYADLDAYNGMRVEIEGTFSHVEGHHGLLTLDSGLRITLPHFDQWRNGDDWHKYVGRRCVAEGILLTVERDRDPYRGPTLAVHAFSGP